MKKPSGDAKLIKAYMAGNSGAFEKLFHRYEKPLFAFIMRFILNRDAAQDIFQQIWTKVLNGLPNYQETGKFSSWLFGIANNCCIDEIRRKSIIKKAEKLDSFNINPIQQQETNPENILIKQEIGIHLKEAIESLPIEQKQVVMLRLNGDMPFKEIARILNCPLNTVL